MSRRAWSVAARDSVRLLRGMGNRKMRRAAYAAAERGEQVFASVRYLWHECHHGNREMRHYQPWHWTPGEAGKAVAVRAACVTVARFMAEGWAR